MDCSSITDFQQSTAICIAKKFRNLHIENWFCCFFVPPLGARLNRLPPGSKEAILFCQANTIFVVAKLLLFISRIFVFVFVFVFVFQLDNERRADTGHRWVEILLTLYSTRSSDNVLALVRPDQC